VSLDTDVMRRAEAVVNWDSGWLRWAEVETVLHAFQQAARPGLAGMDVVGDWSPVVVSGGLRRVLDWVEHPSLAVVPEQARWLNAQVKRAILRQVWAGGLNRQDAESAKIG